MLFYNSLHRNMSARTADIAVNPIQVAARLSDASKMAMMFIPERSRRDFVSFTVSISNSLSYKKNRK